MAWVIDGNAAGFAEQGRAGLDSAAADRLNAESRRELDRRAGLLERHDCSLIVRDVEKLSMIVSDALGE